MLNGAVHAGNTYVEWGGPRGKCISISRTWRPWVRMCGMGGGIAGSISRMGRPFRKCIRTSRAHVRAKTDLKDRHLLRTCLLQRARLPKPVLLCIRICMNRMARAYINAYRHARTCGGLEGEKECLLQVLVLVQASEVPTRTQHIIEIRALLAYYSRIGYARLERAARVHTTNK